MAFSLSDSYRLESHEEKDGDYHRMKAREWGRGKGNTLERMDATTRQANGGMFGGIMFIKCYIAICKKKS